MSNIEHSIRII